MAVIKAGDIATHHLGRAVGIPGHVNRPTFVLSGFNVFLCKPPYDHASRVDLLDRQGRWYSLSAYDPIDIEP